LKNIIFDLILNFNYKFHLNKRLYFNISVALYMKTIKNHQKNALILTCLLQKCVIKILIKDKNVLILVYTLYFVCYLCKDAKN
jgi:hypothetical protein